MAVRGWGVSIATAVGVAAAAGAAQLGIAYGTGVITWRPEPDGLAQAAWSVGVIWAAWIAATSVIAGSVIADRLHSSRPVTAATELANDGDGDRLTRLLWRLVLAVGAGVGAMITVALVAVPARDASVVDVAAPQALAVGYVGLGVLVGVVISVAALAARAVAANLIATAGWLWVLAIAAVVEAVLAGRDWSAVALGFWNLQVGELWAGNLLLPEAGVAVGAALVIGALAALPAARRGDHPVGVVISGGAGPLVLAIAYLLAQPNLTAAAAEELSRHLVAPYLVLAGLAGSLLASAVHPRGSGDDDDGPDHDADEDIDEEAGVPVPAARQPA
jgi:hypothetical protein